MENRYYLNICENCPLAVKRSWLYKLIRPDFESCDGPVRVNVGAKVETSEQSIKPEMERLAKSVCSKTVSPFSLSVSEGIKMEAEEFFIKEYNWRLDRVNQGYHLKGCDKLRTFGQYQELETNEGNA